MAKIKVGKNKWAQVDDADYAMLAGFKWSVSPQGYAVTYHTSVYLPSDGLSKKIRVTRAILMHRMVLGLDRRKVIDAKTGRPCVTDHKDGDRLNNRRANLRVCTRRENILNRKGWGNRPYKGVYYDARRKQWQARVTRQGVVSHLGYWPTAYWAARAYDCYVTSYDGPYARPNFPDLA